MFYFPFSRIILELFCFLHLFFLAWNYKMIVFSETFARCVMRKTIFRKYLPWSQKQSPGGVL